MYPLQPTCHLVHCKWAYWQSPTYNMPGTIRRNLWSQLEQKISQFTSSCFGLSLQTYLSLHCHRIVIDYLLFSEVVMVSLLCACAHTVPCVWNAFPLVVCCFAPHSVQAFFLFLNWSITDVQRYICFRCTTLRFDIYLHYKMITVINLVNFCHHLKLLPYCWPYFLFYIVYLHDL